MTHAMQMLFSLEARELVGNRWSKEEIQIFYKSKYQTIIFRSLNPRG